MATITVDMRALASLAAAEARRHPARTPERRAAARVWVCLITTSTVTAARTAISSYGDPATHRDALALLHRLASQERTT